MAPRVSLSLTILLPLLTFLLTCNRSRQDRQSNLCESSDPCSGILRTAELSEKWDILYHLGGNGPWIELADGQASPTGVEVPVGCRVDQVHMLARHAERYPTGSVGMRM